MAFSSKGKLDTTDVDDKVKGSSKAAGKKLGKSVAGKLKGSK